MKRRGSIILIIVIIIGSILLLGSLLAISWYTVNLRPADKNSKVGHLVDVDDGDSALLVAESLERKGIIKSGTAFQMYLSTHRLRNKIQSGIYRLGAYMSVPEIATRITTGDREQIKITITDGMRLSQIKARLLSKGFNQEAVNAAFAKNYSYSILADKPADASLEGYLFPDTYHLTVSESVDTLLDLILAHTDEQVTSSIRSSWRQKGLTLHQGLTLASIVQKEVSIFEDQQKVAQVFLKRLSIGMKLEADPTYEYAAVLTNQAPSISINSPYNTYKAAGLPPTPIAMPGLTALKSVAEPAPTDYLYFVSSPQGVTYFSSTIEEHTENIRKYLN